MTKAWFVIVLPLLLLFSCVSNQQVVYFQENTFKQDTLIEIINKEVEYRLKPHDVLAINVSGLDDQQANFLGNKSGMVYTQVSPSSLFLNGYAISNDGFVLLPVIGRVMVAELTIWEAQTLIQSSIDEYLTNSTVTVNLVSFKISILGEVNKPGQYYIYSTKITLPEAIALAGELKEFANRKKITLIRQTGKGSAATIIDITDPNVFASPYFYLRPDDMIYIEPLEIKNKRSNLANVPIVNTIIGGLSATFTLILLIDRLNN